MNKENINIQEVIEKYTGEIFNRDNKICCPFHKEKSPSFSINKHTNKFKCFGCGISGDSIDFLKAFKGIDYIQSCKELNIDLDDYRQNIESDKDIIRKNVSNLIDIFRFVDEDNKTLYYKVKYKKNNDKKSTPYCSVVNNEFIWGRNNLKEVPYNLYSITKSIKENKPVFIVEGEKDANTLINLGYRATSFIGLAKDFDYSIFKGANIYIIGDTGKVGEGKVKEIKDNLFEIVKKLHIVKLKDIEKLGDNKDVTDWLENGNTKKDLEKCIKKSLDLKNKYELQQDYRGIYKTIFKTKGEEIEEKQVMITNFNIISALNTRFIDEEKEGIELKILTSDNEEIIRIGDVSVFDDVKSFKNFLGSMALTFNGKIEDLNSLKDWIYKYLTVDTQKIYTGIQFKDGKLITTNGAITKKDNINNIFCKATTPTILNGNDTLTLEECKILLKHLFSFNNSKHCYAIIGTIIHNLAYEFAKNEGVKLHHLVVIGESGSGKSRTKRHIINPLLGYSSEHEGSSIADITKFALTKSLSEGNYTKIFDEFKPSEMTEHTLKMVGSLLRNSYDGMSVDRGNKDMTVTSYKLCCPVVLCGEENFPNEEKALVERSLTVYLSKGERTAANTKSFEWLKENEILLNKLGNTVLKYILNMDISEYKEIRSLYKKDLNPKEFKDRPLETFINACTGIHLMNEAIKKINPYIGTSDDYIDLISEVIRENVLKDGEESHTIYENMLLKINDMVLSNSYFKDSDTNMLYIFKDKGEFKTYIKVNLILAELSKYIKTYGLKDPLLSKNDFIKQCEKSGYIIKKDKQIKLNGKNQRFAEFNVEKLVQLGCEELVVSEIIDKKSKIEKENILSIV